ncbi:hypothetical protein TUM4636_09810 [Shewanella glacialipiscicola]|uniref:Uncharacterized protein n=1 Tax=Shewanella glacialipiscicola TaxID=614069 RepID=A0ABQ6J6Z9_9GAMM|nr:hypothetical protein TUM4636_09810 [Shewanella glacialipiscicola]GMA82611.1 hypothetical protein GCM10025855_21440 [Shewanella glacialipiscicola]
MQISIKLVHLKTASTVNSIDNSSQQRLKYNEFNGSDYETVYDTRTRKDDIQPCINVKIQPTTAILQFNVTRD